MLKTQPVLTHHFSPRYFHISYSYIIYRSGYRHRLSTPRSSAIPHSSLRFSIGPLINPWNLKKKKDWKICICCNNVLILRLKGLRSGGKELQPCLSRYILWAVYCYFSTQPHRAVARKQLLKRCYFWILWLWNLAVYTRLKVFDNSTYIVGIIMLHGSGASMLYRCGAVVLSEP